MGYKGGKIFNNMAETWKEIVEKVSPDAAEGAMGLYKDIRVYRKEKWVQDLREAYEKKYGVWETDALNWIAGWFVFVTAVNKANSFEVDDMVKALDGLEVDCLEVKRQFFPRPDKNNPRTCDACQEYVAGVVKGGKFQISRIIPIKEEYDLSIRAFGVQDAFKRKK